MLFYGNGIIPIGGIIMWSGTDGDVPTNWALCNGSSGTPTGTQHGSNKKITFHWDSAGLVQLNSGCEFSAEL